MHSAKYKNSDQRHIEDNKMDVNKYSMHNIEHKIHDEQYHMSPRVSFSRYHENDNKLTSEWSIPGLIQFLRRLLQFIT